MPKRTLAILIAAAVATATAGGLGSAGHSTPPEKTAAPPTLLASPAASLAVGSLLAPARGQGLPATNAALLHTRSHTSRGQSATTSNEVPDSSRTKTIQVHSHSTEPPGDLGAQCLATIPPECQVRFVGTSTFTGTLWGVEHDDIYGSVTPDGHLAVEGVGVLTGGVEGCGTGSYILEYGGYFDLTRFDPVTQSVPGSTTWRLRTGSGTGQLADLVSGQGTGDETFYAIGKGNDPNKSVEADFTGTITCSTS